MTALLVVLMVILFVVTDALVRAASARLAAARARREREAILSSAVRLDYASEAKSLKRVEVPHPRARILAVDDEPVVLDGFRKILVLEGYDVDTVESGAEAVGLVQRNDYDFVFTDLKMPGMDGVEVVKAVRHLRPDVDVAVITGYGTISTAVETMQQGAVDYVQKPFTEEELTAFVRRLMVKREARLEALRKPVVRVVPPAAAEPERPGEFHIPGGTFVSPAHVWVRIESDGRVRAGLDDFARRALGEFEAIRLPPAGSEVEESSVLFSVRRGSEELHFVAPLAGKVVRVNESLARFPLLLRQSPYDRGWVCLLEPRDLAAALPALRIGRPLVDWFQGEIERFRAERGGPPESPPVPAWGAFERDFLKARKAA